jgi:phosphonate transport system substrate-binding protein
LTWATVASKVRRVRFPILRFGVVPVVDGPTFRADLSRVCRALGYYLGTTVECRPLPTYAKLVTLLSQAQLDAAWVPPVVAMDCGAMRIARPRIAMVRQRETAYHAVLFTLQDSPIRSLADLQKVKAAWVSPDSASGYLVPLASLRARGVSLSKAFADQIFVGTHEAVARAVAEGRAQVGASFAHFGPADPRVPVSASWIESKVEADFRILLAAGPIPTDVIAMHRTMDEGHQQALISAFGWLVTRPEAAAANAIFRCDGFEGCGDEHLRGLRKLIRLLDRPAMC